MVSEGRIEQAITLIASIEHVYLDPVCLVEDVIGLAKAFPQDADFESAVFQTARAMQLLVDRKVSSSALENDFEGWDCHHYQMRVVQGERARLRIMYEFTQDGVRVRGFGDRRMPADFYRRMAGERRLHLAGENEERE